MDLVQLRYFVRVADCGNFSKAAAELHVAQPALTRQVRLLEEELGVPLLVRHSRGAEPTEAGVLLRERAVALIKSAQAMREEVIERASSTSGALRLGFPPSIEILLIGDVVASYRENFPLVRLHLVENFSHILREWLLEERLDMACTTEFEPNPALVATPLFDEQLWLAASPDMPQLPEAISVAAISQYELIQTSDSNNLRVMLERAVSKAGGQINVTMEAEAPSLIKNLVRRGIGYHVAPYSSLMEDFESGFLRGAPIVGISLRRVMQRRADRPLTGAITKMMEMIQSRVLVASQHHGDAIRPI